jgi:hypothetical protein
MGKSISDEVKEIYAKKKLELKEKTASLRKELKITIDQKRNESYKEVESK